MIKSITKRSSHYCGNTVFLGVFYKNHKGKFTKYSLLLSAIQQNWLDPYMYRWLSLRLFIVIQNPTSGLTPVHWACEKGNKDLVQDLILAGGNIFKVDNQGESCFDIAKRQGHDDVVEWLILFCFQVCSTHFKMILCFCA